MLDGGYIIPFRPVLCVHNESLLFSLSILKHTKNIDEIVLSK